jgi:hypothetical protein
MRKFHIPYTPIIAKLSGTVQNFFALLLFLTGRGERLGPANTCRAGDFE